MYMSRWTLREQFDPREYPQETYLLCKVQWGNKGKPWTHWVRNDGPTKRHAEVCFLDKIFELRSFKVCYITWYLSWSPCEKCCYRIWDFLERHPNVNIAIYVARIYVARSATAHRGLRDLASLQRVTIKVMKIKDYVYCWDTFLRRDNADYDFSPKEFKSAIQMNCSRLKNILQVEKGNNIMREKLRVRFFSFGFQCGKFIDFYLELQSHLRNPPPDFFLTWI